MDVTRTVYGVTFPETRRIVDALWAERPHQWYERNYTKRQDSMHEPCLARWRAWAGAAGVSLGEGFRHEYPTAGANEAIHALLAHHATHGGKRIHVFAGEYEGYTYAATAFGLTLVVHARDDHRRSLLAEAGRGDQFWLSQPSAIDGNLWDGFAEFRDWLAAALPGIGLVVDLTYVGAVPIACTIELGAEPVSAVLWSLSKPFGVYYHRIGGLLSRTEVPSLHGHLWFKNLFSIHLGERLMETHPARELPARYQPVQARALERAQAAGLVPRAAMPSHAVMLAHAPAEPAFLEYARGPGLRFCLSPSIDRMVNHEEPPRAPNA